MSAPALRLTVADGGHDGPESLAEVREEWRLAQLAAGNAANSLRVRLNLLDRLEVWLGGDPRTATTADLQRFLAQPHFSAATRGAYHRHLLCWFDFLVITDRLPRSPLLRVKPPRVPKGVPRPVDTAALDEAIRAASGRLRAWILLGAYQGLRISEIAAVRGEHFSDGVLYVQGKGGKKAALPVHPSVQALRAEFPARGLWWASCDRWGNVVQPAEPMGVRSIRRGIVDHFQATSGTVVKVHGLRHWFVTECLRASGGNLRVAQELARHDSVATTEGYARVLSSERDAAVAGLPVLGGAR